MNYSPSERNTIIEENVDYVLGMYDLYQNDEEIKTILVKKGLPFGIIQQVLTRIKIPAYEKRIRQAKKLLITGLAIVIGFVVLGFLLKSIPNSESLLTNTDPEEGHLRWMLRVYRRSYYYIIVAGLIQIVLGTFKLIKYKRLLNTSKL